MKLEDLGFEPEPQIDWEAWNFEDHSDVYALVEEDVIGLPQEYGYEDPEEYVRDVVDFLGVGSLDQRRQKEHREKWERFVQEYKEAGDVFYNPENGDEYYTDDPRVL